MHQRKLSSEATTLRSSFCRVDCLYSGYLVHLLTLIPRVFLIMFVLTIRQNIQSAILTYRPNEIRSEYFLYGTNNCLKRASLYSHDEIVAKFLQSSRKIFGN